MKKYLSVLSRCPLFSGIEPENILTMLSCMDAQIIKTPKNHPVFREGTPAKYVGLVLSGRVQVVRHTICGSRHIIAATDPAQIFGAAFACAAVETLPVSAIASQDSEILLIDCKRILTVCSNTCAFHARLISNLLRIVAERNIHVSQKLDIISMRTTREKLLAFLAWQAKQAGSNRFTIAYNRQQLADYLGLGRCAMTTELTKLKKDGLIDFSGNEFTLLIAQEEHPA